MSSCVASSKLEYESMDDRRRSNPEGFGDGGRLWWLDCHCDTRFLTPEVGARSEALLLEIAVGLGGGVGLLSAMGGCLDSCFKRSVHQSVREHESRYMLSQRRDCILARPCAIQPSINISALESKQHTAIPIADMLLHVDAKTGLDGFTVLLD